MSRLAPLIWFGLLASASPLRAGADPLCQLYKDQAKAIQAQPKGSRAAQIDAILPPDQHAVCIASIMAQNAEKGFVREFEALRTDEQAGASAGSGNGTSLVSKGATAKALSIAAEYGALTQSVSGQTVTVKGSLDGIPGALIRGGLAMYCIDGIDRSLQKGCIGKNGLNLLRRLSYSISFDTSRTTQTITGTPSASPASGTAPTPVTFTPSGHQISAISGRFDLWNQRDATSTAYLDQWGKSVQDKNGGQALSTAAGSVLTAFQTLLGDKLRASPAYQAWFSKAANTLQNADNVEAAWISLLPGLLESIKDSVGTANDASGFLQAISRYDLEQDQLIATAADKPVLALEYDNNRPVGQDSNSTIRLIFDKGFGKDWSVTLNGAIDIWDRNQSTASTQISLVRDVQAGLEIDYQLNGLKKLLNSAAVLSGAYYFQDQHSAILLNVDPTQPLPGINFTGLPSTATAVLADTGNIHMAQLKLTLGAGSTDVKVPIAFTYSNRSELVPKPSWRAEIGVSYDFDSLFTK